jgi:hypothetical protein
MSDWDASKHKKNHLKNKNNNQYYNGIENENDDANNDYANIHGVTTTKHTLLMQVVL